jgi:hypothetical protein
MNRLWAKIGIGALIVATAIAGGLWAMKWFAPALVDRRPKLADVPPLAPVIRSSVIVTPVAIELMAIRDALEKAAPRDLSGKPDMPFPTDVFNTEIVWSLTRDAFGVVGRPEGLSLSTALRGSFRATGQMTINRRAEIAGSIMLTARPSLLPRWRLEPNMVAQVRISDASMSVMGMQFNLSDEMKPMVERTINEQVSELQAWMSNDPSLEQAARREWAKMCRSIPLNRAGGQMPNLWLELRPTRALAAQPRIDDNAVTLTIGVQAETRILPGETKPDCPFPAQLNFVPQMEQGRVSIDLPIDIPLTEISRLIEAQLKGKTFPEDRSGAFTATVKSVNLAASGNRLLISLGVTASETKSWFGLSADATIHVWGRPVLDRGRQVLRFEDIALDVESAAAFGALGAAARTAIPYLERSFADNAVIDLVPLAASARKNIDAAIADFRNSADGIRVDAAVVDLRLADVEFDANTLRVVAEADGTVRVAVTKLNEK